MSLLNSVKEARQKLKEVSAGTEQEIEQFRIEYLGSKGKIKQLFGEFRNVASEDKKEFGQLLNSLKKEAEERLLELKSKVHSSENKSETGATDYSRPVSPELGARHPVTIVLHDVIEIFNRMGFAIAEGPEIEDDWHNFTALNFPPEHPARDMQDTFFLDESKVWALRTHTSSVQVRTMENEKPPIRIIAPGRVFRNETISARSHCIFHQVEGLYISKDVSFADMKQTLLQFAREMFGADAKIRLRASYFPFTEPSAEMDVYWGLETETDYRITKGTGWLEIMGCGMVDPNVLTNCGIDPEEYSGYAFGMGIERMAMLKFGIPDIRLLFENDVRFLKQFVGW